MDENPNEDRMAALERRLRRLEDEREIAQLIAAYGPLVDGGAAEDVAELWTTDGVYDVDEVFMDGRDELRAMVTGANHQGWIAGGCAHFLGPARIHVTGDEAIAVCHSLMIVNEGGAFGEDPRFVVRRATAHHWQLRRGPEGWRTTRRTSRVLDGRPESPALLVKGARGEPA